VRESGFGGLSIRDLAKRAGTTTPTLYTYFESKHAVFDAMFAEGQRQMAAMRAEARPEDPIDALRWEVETFLRFCGQDSVRYQLMFQRPVPGFQPSADSFALAKDNLALAQECLARAGLGAPVHLDVWTALWSGVASQQNANDPEGDRWTRHLDTMLEMYLNQFLPRRPKRRHAP
jgi:AcrR family transcriptional regulator